jgi:hypothetical protein
MQYSQFVSVNFRVTLERSPSNGKLLMLEAAKSLSRIFILKSASIIPGIGTYNVGTFN